MSSLGCRRCPPGSPAPCPEEGTRPVRCGELADAPRPSPSSVPPFPFLPPSRPGETNVATARYCHRSRSPKARQEGSGAPSPSRETTAPASHWSLHCRLPHAHSPGRLSPPWRWDHRAARRKFGGGGGPRMPEGRDGAGRAARPRRPRKSWDGAAGLVLQLREASAARLRPARWAPAARAWAAGKGFVMRRLRLAQEAKAAAPPAWKNGFSRRGIAPGLS